MAGMGAGSFIIGMIIHWFVKPSVPINLFGFNVDIADPALLWGPIFVAVGAPFLILDLGIKRRFLYACLNPRTSWLARGFLILSTFIVLGLIVFGASLLYPQILIDRTAPWLVLEVISVIFAFCHSHLHRCSPEVCQIHTDMEYSSPSCSVFGLCPIDWVHGNHPGDAGIGTSLLSCGHAYCL